MVQRQWIRGSLSRQTNRLNHLEFDDPNSNLHSCRVDLLLTDGSTTLPGDKGRATWATTLGLNDYSPISKTSIKDHQSRHVSKYSTPQND
jgi:hypothetical protein